MKKKIIFLLCILFLLSGCRKKDVIKENIDTIRQSIQTEMDKAVNSKYSNLEFQCDKVDFPEESTLEVVELEIRTLKLEDATVDNVNITVDMFKRLLGNDDIDLNYVYIIDESDMLDETTNYYDLIDSIDSYNSCPLLLYRNPEESQSVEMVPACLYVSKGVIDSFSEEPSYYFGAPSIFEHIKTYDCINDDLSDSYMLLDGEKTVDEGRREIEEYLNNMYPLNGEDNSVKHKVLFIDVCKVPGKEIYAYHAIRTFSYQGIPFRIMENGSSVSGMSTNETSIMAEDYMIESNDVDISVGIINNYYDVTTVESITDIVPFETVLNNVSNYLTAGATFTVNNVGIEYRLFSQNDENGGIRIIPYWYFSLTNNSDLSDLKVYVDIQTGDTRGIRVER